jgi:tripartite-type tricarboxylate transporter receptor subunit TctC
MNLNNIFAMAGVAAFMVAAPAAAQGFPSKPIRFIVPNGMGGSTDLVARAIAQKLSETLGHQVVVDNRPGAGGTVGTVMVAQAPADGHTLLMGTIGNLAISPALYNKLPYDPVKDFDSVTQLAASAYVLAIHPAIAAKSVVEFVQLAKAKPGGMNFASAGSGTGSHLTMELFKSVAGVNLVHIPYKGGTAGLTEVISGQVHAMFNGIPSTVPHVRTGRLRVLVVSTPKRVAVLPDTPTLAEQGFPKAESTSWTSLMVPKGTPAAIVNKLYQESAKALQSPDVRERLQFDGAEPVGSKPAEFAAYLRQELVKWAGVVKVSGAKAD